MTLSLAGIVIEVLLFRGFEFDEHETESERVKKAGVVVGFVWRRKGYMGIFKN